MTNRRSSGDVPPLCCPVCGGAEISLERQEGTVRTGKDSYVPAWEEFSRCGTCGEEFVTQEQSAANSRAYVAAVRKAQGLVSADEIRDARLRLGMSQSEFENALGVGRKTVVRWERGTVFPSNAANGLLWLASRHPAVFLEYASRHSSQARPSGRRGEIIATIAQAPSPNEPPPVARYRAGGTKLTVAPTASPVLDTNTGISGGTS